MKKYTYLLTHTYSKNKSITDVVFKSTYRPCELPHIVAYTQYLTDKISHAKELDEINTVLILKAFYDNNIEILESKEDIDYTLDMYSNWEYYCSDAGKILEDVRYFREGLPQVINHLVEVEDLLHKVLINK